MFNIFRFLVDGCWHNWKETRRATLVRGFNDDIVGEAVYCTCTKCGKPVRFKLA